MTESLSMVLNDDCLVIDGVSYDINEDGAAEVVASALKRHRLLDLPVGASVVLCDRVVGSTDVYHRSPPCTFSHPNDDVFIAKVDTAILPESDDLSARGLAEWSAEARKGAQSALQRALSEGTIFDFTVDVYDDIIYYGYSAPISDQPFPDAEDYVAAIDPVGGVTAEDRILFVCHASEDLAFTTRLVTALDRRALRAWFDRREIVVGDSIVQRVNVALQEARFLVVVLSDNSVAKPWVQRELNSTLLRQLREEQVTILPVLLEDCSVPPLLADLKYADFRTSFDEGLDMLVRAVKTR